MLVFITTLRHPHNSSDYRRVEALLQDTLWSVGRQTDRDYRVVIVGNQQPAFALPERTEFVEVDFPPPSRVNGPQTGPASVIWDKGTKTAIGLMAAQKFRPDYVMPFDADDFVHRDIAQFANARPGTGGWVVSRGLMYSRARNAYALRRKFYRICGTSFIVPMEAYEIPPELDVSATQRDIADAFGERLEHILEHGFAFDWWRKHGRVLQALPFAGAVYHVDTGENHSGNVLYGPAIPYRQSLYRDYGLRSAKGRAATLWSALGPVALKPDLRFRRHTPPASYLADYTPPAA
ncbi:glycosyltransferase family A protein [Mycolicibacterium vaccae]|uniref:glycosyltransferase family A protein n=1 Tax=Mycolicibacterium vaccae TaxID=1810 RepID=UPI003CF302BF